MKKKYQEKKFFLIVTLLFGLISCSNSRNFTAIEREVTENAVRLSVNDFNINSLKQGNGYYYLLDSRGVVLCHPEKALKGKNFGNINFVSTMLEKKNGCIKGIFENKERIIIFRQSGNNILCYTISPEYIKGSYNCEIYTGEAK